MKWIRTWNFMKDVKRFCRQEEALLYSNISSRTWCIWKWNLAVECYEWINEWAVVEDNVFFKKKNTKSLLTSHLSNSIADISTGDCKNVNVRVAWNTCCISWVELHIVLDVQTTCADIRIIFVGNYRANTTCSNVN